MKWQVNDAVLVSWQWHTMKELFRVEAVTSDGEAVIRRHNVYWTSKDCDCDKIGTFRRTWYGGWKFVPLK